MPRIILKIPTAKMSWTKIPNQILDQHLPTLKDTELRVLLVVIRQSLGWQQPRSMVFLSYHTLARRTGRGLAALALAIRGLEQKGLIHRPIAATARRPHRLPADHMKSEENK
jgi:hypothetical protein